MSFLPYLAFLGYWLGLDTAMVEFSATSGQSAFLYLIVSQGSIPRKPAGRLAVNGLPGTYLLE
jgi:hypothetical protein